jgi:hypothetical protein
MTDRIRVRIHLDDHWTVRLAIECPSCGAVQETPANTAHSGEEFVCDCGEDVRLTAEALAPVQHELDALKGHIEQTVSVVL